MHRNDRHPNQDTGSAQRREGQRNQGGKRQEICNALKHFLFTQTTMENVNVG